MMISSFGQVIVISKIAIINAMAEWHHGNVIINCFSKLDHQNKTSYISRRALQLYSGLEVG